MKKVYSVVFVVIILIAVFYSYEKREAFHFAKATRNKKILFVGDMMFDRYIRKVGYERGGDFIFSCANLSGFLKGFDLVLGNLEGPITENASRSMLTEPRSDNNFVFTFPTNTAGLLAENNIKLVNLGNNHISNFGQEGIDSTKKYLAESGIKYFGQPGEALAKWGKFSFISYNEFGGESAQKIAKKILEEKNNGQMVLVYAHWGDEYVPPPERVKKLARSFIDVGAEMIIGSHPHIVQESEIYKGKHIYYSLGNFIFDQYWDKEVSTGLVLEVKIENGKIEILEHKVSLNKDGRTCLTN